MHNGTVASRSTALVHHTITPTSKPIRYTSCIIFECLKLFKFNVNMCSLVSLKDPTPPNQCKIVSIGIVVIINSPLPSIMVACLSTYPYNCLQCFRKFKYWRKYLEFLFENIYVSKIFVRKANIWRVVMSVNRLIS